MSARALHLENDLLSAYLDGEVPAADARALEDHLAACAGCRARLDGLRRAVGALARLERAAPPPLLAHQVERRVALEGRRAGLTERLENRLQGLTLQSPMVVAFTVVLALAVIVYLFAQGVARHEPLLVPVRGAPAEPPPAAGDPAPADPAPGDAAPGNALPGGAAPGEPEIRSDVPVLLGGRTFVVRDGLWHEQAVGTREPELRVTTDDPEGRELLARHPWIERLLAARDGVVLLEDGRVIELRVSGSSAAAAPVDDDVD
ncbi:MAG TPA: zf-HC2 domain-containing protein [Thermoanaerobaculia bacterium]|nr:zf-HC2 domain-containing protein [Thermoanaerobaculia bacterium]